MYYLQLYLKNKTHLGGKVGLREDFILDSEIKKESVVTQESNPEKSVTEIRQSIHLCFPSSLWDDLMTSDLWTWGTSQTISSRPVIENHIHPFAESLPCEDFREK